MTQAEAREVLARRLAVAEKRGTEVQLPQFVARVLLDEQQPKGESDAGSED